MPPCEHEKCSVVPKISKSWCCTISKSCSQFPSYLVLSRTGSSADQCICNELARAPACMRCVLGRTRAETRRSMQLLVPPKCNRKSCNAVCADLMQQPPRGERPSQDGKPDCRLLRTRAYAGCVAHSAACVWNLQLHRIPARPELRTNNLRVSFDVRRQH